MLLAVTLGLLFVFLTVGKLNLATAPQVILSGIAYATFVHLNIFTEVKERTTIRVPMLVPKQSVLNMGGSKEPDYAPPSYTPPQKV